MRYAQEYGGQKLHLVREVDPGLNGGNPVENVALCGRRPTKRGAWRMTINVPLGHACKRCLRVLRRLQRTGGGNGR